MAIKWTSALCKSFAAVMFFAIGLLGIAPGQTIPTRQHLYKWFDSLGFTAQMKGTFGELRYQAPSYGPNQQLPLGWGFFQSGDSKNFTVVTLGLRTVHTVNGRVAPDPGITSVTFHPVDLRGWLVGQKKILKDYIDHVGSGHSIVDFPPPFYGYSPYLTSDFVLARLADLNGLPYLSEWFYQQADDAYQLVYAGKYGSLDESIKACLAQEFLDNTRSDFADLSLSRFELLKRVEFVAKHFPETEAGIEAGVYATNLAFMSNEDLKRKPLPPMAFKKLTPEAKAKELVWQLRDQNGRQWSNPGYADVFATKDMKQTSPADQLKKMGLAAVPALIDALSDKSLTRTVGGGNWRSPYVIAVRDAAVEILENCHSVRIRGTELNPSATKMPKTRGQHSELGGNILEMLAKNRCWSKEFPKAETMRPGKPGDLWRNIPKRPYRRSVRHWQIQGTVIVDTI